MIELVTERLSLRPFRAADRGLLAALVRDPDVFFWEKQPVSDAAIDRILDLTRRLQARGMGWFAAFRSQHPGDFVGTVALKPTIPGARAADQDPPDPGPDDVEISWHLMPRYWGHGFASEGARAVLDHAMRIVRPERVVAFALPDNIRSLRVIRRVGLPYIGDRHHAGRPHAFFALSRKAYLTAAPATPPKTGRSSPHA